MCKTVIFQKIVPFLAKAGTDTTFLENILCFIFKAPSFLMSFLALAAVDFFDLGGILGSHAAVLFQWRPEHADNAPFLTDFCLFVEQASSGSTADNDT